MPAIRALNHTQEAILAAHPRRHRVSPLRSRAFIGSNETLWSPWVIVGSIGWSSTPAISAPSTARRRRRAAWSFRRDADADRPVDAGTPTEVAPLVAGPVLTPHQLRSLGSCGGRANAGGQTTAGTSARVMPCRRAASWLGRTPNWRRSIRGASTLTSRGRSSSRSNRITTSLDSSGASLTTIPDGVVPPRAAGRPARPAAASPRSWAGATRTSRTRPDSGPPVARRSCTCGPASTASRRCSGTSASRPRHGVLRPTGSPAS